MSTMKDSGDYIEERDYLRALYAAKTDEEKVLLTILWKTGRRVSEILGIPKSPVHGLKPLDIDWKNKVIHFWIIKKRENYKSPKPVDDELLAILSSYIEQKGIPPEQRIIPKTRQWFDLVLKRISDKTGIRTFSGKRIRSKTFRHTWNRRAAMNAETPEDIALQKAYMEHSSENVTMSYYMKFGTKAQRKLIEKMKE